MHETAEEELIHPLTRRDSDRVVEAHLKEEHAAKTLLKKMMEAGADDPGFPANLMSLRTMVVEHAEHEEAHEFPLLRANHPDELRKLAPLLKAAEAVAPTRPHPGLETATANVLAGPFLSIADRVRDAVRS